MESLLDLLQDSPFAIWALWGLLVLCGVGLPMPEDVILIAAGLIAAESGDSWISTSILMYFGVMAGDSLIFIIGRRYGARVLASRWTQRWLSPAKQERIARMFDRFGSAAFFFARFMPGLRAPIFCTAGAMKARYLQFVFFDGLAALISVPAFVWLGYFLWRSFGDDFEQLNGALSRTHFYSMVVAGVILTALVSLLWVNRRKLFHSRAPESKAPEKSKA